MLQYLAGEDIMLEEPESFGAKPGDVSAASNKDVVLRAKLVVSETYLDSIVLHTCFNMRIQPTEHMI